MSLALLPKAHPSLSVESANGWKFYQQRISLFALVSIGIGVIAQAISLWVYFFAPEEIAMTPWKAAGNLGTILGAFLIWLRTRSGNRSSLELAIHDVLLVLTPLAYWAAMFWGGPHNSRAGQMLGLGATNLLTLRAVLVPSTGRRTAWFGLANLIVIAGWTFFYRSRGGPPAGGGAWVAAGAVALVCVIGIVVPTVASETIFGLRRAVHRAMQLGQYRLLRKIGEGGMGVVWEAKHALLRRRTAVKLLPTDRAGERAIERFEREVQLTSTLTHPNTIMIYDYGRSEDGTFYYAMEYLDGLDLEELVERDGPQSPAMVAHVLAQVSVALAEAHGIGLIHRDVKPANIFLCERGGMPLIAKVLDFGLVKQFDADVSKLSAATTIVGTPLYMPPESITGGVPIDARSDLYSLGAVGYYLLTGKPPFEGKSAIEVLFHHMQTTPVAPSLRRGAPLPADLEAIVLACLQKVSPPVTF